MISVIMITYIVDDQVNPIVTCAHALQTPMDSTHIERNHALDSL